MCSDPYIHTHTHTPQKKEKEKEVKDNGVQWLQPTSNNIAKIKIRNKFVKNSPSS